MALGPISSDPALLRLMNAQTLRSGAHLASASRAVEVQQKTVADADSASRDEVSLGGSGSFSAEASSSFPVAPQEPPAPRAAAPLVEGPGYRASSLHGPLLMFDESAAPCVGTGKDASEGCRLSHAEHLRLQADARSRGTVSVKVADAGGVEHVVNVHGASPTEQKRIEKALLDLGKADTYGLILPSVHDVHVTDALGSSARGKPVMGVAVQADGETAITLSRMQGQASRNPLESLSHVKEVLYHEIGHAVDNKYAVSGLAEAGYGAGEASKVGAGGDFITKYASTNGKEDYAESFSNYYVYKTCGDLEGCSDDELVGLALLGDDGKSAAAEKMRAVPRDLGPQVAVKQHVLALGQASGVRSVVRSFYDDPSFRAGTVDSILKQRPRVPREAIYDFMERSAQLLGEAPMPQAKRADLPAAS